MRKRNKKLMRSVMLFGALSVVVTYGFIIIFDLLNKYQEMSRENVEVQLLLEEERAREQELSDIIHKINDPEYLKSYAKENYLYSENGSIIIRIPEEEEE